MKKLISFVTLRSSIVLTATVVAALRAVGALIYRPLLVEKITPGSLLYLFLSGVLWLVVGVWLLLKFWQENKAAEKQMALAALLYGIWYWGERLWLQPMPGNAPFALVMTLVLEAVFWLPISLPLVHAHLFPKGESYE
ncbi:MAG: hypothetical protein WHS87_01635 [Anaerolineales bacterium]